jgi:hypothetical protein
LTVVDSRPVIFRRGGVLASGGGLRGIKPTPPPPPVTPPTSSGPGQGQGKGQGVGGGRGTGKGQGNGLAALALALGAISSTRGAVVASAPTVPAGALVLLSTTTLGGAGIIDVAGIDQTYNDLVIMVVARGSRGLTNDSLSINFNNDATANYDQQGVYGTTSTANGFSDEGTTVPIISDLIVASTAAAGLFGFCEIVVPGYTSTTWQKSAIGTWGAFAVSGTHLSGVSTVFWRSTAAINRVQLFGTSSANLLTGSTCRVYGRK